MSETNAPERTDRLAIWLSPSTILPILGMVGMGYASYTTFQRDTSGKVAELEWRVAASERRLAAQEASITDDSKFNAEANLRLTLLEGGRKR